MPDADQTNATSGRTARTRWQLGALSVGALAAAAVLTGCSGGITGKAIPALQPAVAAPAQTATPATPSTNPTRPKPAPPKPASVPGNSSGKTFDAAIGECVTLEGTPSNPTINAAVCGSPASNFKVVDKVATHQECVADADIWYANTQNGKETSALCLDVDWVVGGCVTTAGDWPLRIACTPGNADIVRVVQIIMGSDDSSKCTGGRGGVYSERKVVVCVESV